MGMLMSSLFIKTWVKGEQTYVAMESRCYDGSIKTINDLGNVRSIGIKNFLFLLLFEGILTARSLSHCKFQDILENSLI